MKGLRLCCDEDNHDEKKLIKNLYTLLSDNSVKKEPSSKIRVAKGKKRKGVKL